MPEQMSFEEAAVNRIRSIYNSLDNYRRTSMALHNRPRGSMYILAKQRLAMANAIASEWPDSPDVQRWARKVDDYCVQHDLVQLDEE